MPRSMRVTAARPQTCAMSVALLDHGEIVPGRGTTSQRRATRAAARRLRSARARRRHRAAAAGARARTASSARLHLHEMQKLRLDGRDRRHPAPCRRASRRSRRNRGQCPRARQRQHQVFFDPGSPSRRRQQRHRKLRHVAALERHDLADALLAHLIDADDRLQRQVAALDARRTRVFTRSSPGSSTTVERSPNTSSSISTKPNSVPWLTLRA